MSKSNAEATMTSVREYLRAAYIVTDDEVEEALRNPENQTTIIDAHLLKSYAFYPGDKIASANGWRENPAFEEHDDYEEPDEDE